ncbi:Outer membrane lipoprotein-sorting protein [Deinococcus reticulitermitis]|uniref:Outer membrane lipoprotein-sorting protein n=1 Tax=Deinococcus reticulitermitis TaxID=856736 RepID=A0A1H7AM89_9DEIO|nr:outer membrane lipoprotein carrier protein LolA [Deinococcus reticulitermitis]SEJ62125.1 Outer membrane lipoprotein-sorting protein [Deinococcus reticulitermitis]
MRRLLPLLLALGTVAGAQTAQDILNRVDAAQKNSRDLSFRVSGTATLDTSAQKIDFTVKTIPSQSLARLQFLAPDALADNVVVADKKEVRQYLFLTNQITVTPLSKAADNAGLIGFDVTQLSNPAALLAKFNVRLLGTSGAAGNRLYQLEATPKGSGSTDRTRVWITEAGWRPTRLQLVSSAGKTLADLNVSAYKVNSGLTASGLRQLPKSAQVIRQ